MIVLYFMKIKISTCFVIVIKLPLIPYVFYPYYVDTNGIYLNRNKN